MENKLITKRPKLAKPWIYLLITFIWTWFFWGLAILTGADMKSGSGFALLLLGVSGPMFTGITFTYLTRDKAGRKDYWKRVIDFKRIPIRWYLAIFLFALTLHGLSALVDVLFGGSGATWGEAALDFLANPFSIFLSFLFVTLIPFIEELGWRGYLLDRLQEKYSALASSLILGVLWSLWHLPLCFIPGSYQAGLGVGTLAFWLFFLGIIPLSLPFTWIYNNTGRSTLAVILFHAMVNFSGELILLSESAETWYIIWWYIAAVVITVFWGARTLAQWKNHSKSTITDEPSITR
ncbi:MAG: CPBP family intramembrane metalloprotease [Anaerolineaceae bacterium]|nr:CPBP family intramembrane metalloprotease [Anaerolineaceae bacterium]